MFLVFNPTINFLSYLILLRIEQCIWLGVKAHDGYNLQNGVKAFYYDDGLWWWWIMDYDDDEW